MEHNEVNDTGGIVFICKKDPTQVGNGEYTLTAYFMDIKVCVTYKIRCIQHDESLINILAVESFSMHQLALVGGHFENFNRRIGDDDYNTKPIIKAAYTFAMEQAASKATM